jgi:hypothetical protein
MEKKGEALFQRQFKLAQDEAQKSKAALDTLDIALPHKLAKNQSRLTSLTSTQDQLGSR